MYQKMGKSHFANIFTNLLPGRLNLSYNSYYVDLGNL